MNDFPDLLADAVGEQTVIGAVDIGGGDTVAVTDGTTYLYRSDGLLKDESVESFDHAVKQLSVRTKRRKSAIVLRTIDSETDFTVPSNVADPVLEAMMKGILRTNGVVADGEAVSSLFRFSELTLVVTDHRLFEHVGSAVWDEDFETVEYGALTGLDFERGSVATQVVLETRDRRRRVKVPNEHAGTVRREIQEAVFDFHGVTSLDELRSKLVARAEETDSASEESPTGDDEPETADTAVNTKGRSDDNLASKGWTTAADETAATSDETATASLEGFGSTEQTRSREGEVETRPTERNLQPPSEQDSSDAKIEELTNRIDGLSDRIDQQTDLIEAQQTVLEQLVDELKRGR